jgi:two-component system, NtrC family, nitrogen regulation sensor histidine kinase NtrY
MTSSDARLARISATGWRLLFLAILSAALARIWMAQYYLVALAIVLTSALIAFDLWRLLRRATDSREVPVEPAVLRAPAQLEAALALIDSVTVALLVLGPDHRVRFMNRAARELARQEVGRLQDIAVLGESGAAALLRLPVGGRQLIVSEDGRSFLAWVGAMRRAGAEPQRLVSLQSVVGELDAVQVGAWHAMTRVLAHEMMNSLTPIASMAESVESLAATGDRDAKIAGAVATIGRRSRHLMDFVERYRAIVDLPRPALQAVGLADFLRDVDRLVGPDLRRRGIGFVVMAPSNRVASFDAALVEQAILNLIKNAADAVEHTADPLVRLVGLQDADALHIEVHDNGVGIEDDLLEEIFVPFFTTKPDGAGIGLALARQVALAHGGGLTACRAYPAGTVFKLRLPVQS